MLREAGANVGCFGGCCGRVEGGCSRGMGSAVEV